MSESGVKGRLRVGFIVFGVLAAIKIAEYALATVMHKGVCPYLAILAIISAALIAYFYKHIYELWRSRSKDD